MRQEYNKTLKMLLSSISVLALVGCATDSSYTSTNYNENGERPKLIQQPNGNYQNNDNDQDYGSSKNGTRANRPPRNQRYNNGGNRNNNKIPSNGNMGNQGKNTNQNPSASPNPKQAPTNSTYKQPSPATTTPKTTPSSHKPPTKSNDYANAPRNTNVGNIQFEGYQYAGLLPSGKGAYYKVGKPYTIKGYHYSPHEDYGYNKVGKISWYGPGFQGGKTANGEKFDTNTLAGASPILPLPSYVRVTNLSNGKQVIVRVNDRGPYASSRIMDLSKKAAEILDYKNKGTTTARIEILAPESKALKALLLGQKGVNRKGTGSYKMSMGHPDTSDGQPKDKANSSASSPSPKPPLPIAKNKDKNKADNNSVIGGAPLHHPRQIISTSSDYSDSKTKSGNYYIQVGAYATEEKVRIIEKNISKNMGRNMDLTKIKKDGQELYRIRFNNIKSEDKALHLADKLMDLGYKDPKITLQQ